MAIESAFSSDPTIVKAQNELAKKLGLKPEDVTISVGDEDGYSAGDDNAVLRMRIHKAGIDMQSDKKEKEIELRASMEGIPAIAAVAQWTPTVKIAEQVGSQVIAATANTDFDRKLLEWRVFDSKNIKSYGSNRNNIRDYAVTDVRDTGLGIEYGVVVARGDDKQWKETTEKVSEQIRERIPEMREIITERLAKYYEANLKKEGKDGTEIAQKIAQMREDMSKLEITANSNNREGIRITFRSPGQAAAAKNTPPHKEPDNADELKASNPLQHIITRTVSPDDEHPQLHKLLSRALLYTKDKKMPEYFPEIAGTHDVMVAIAKEFHRVKQAHPDRAAQFDEILASPLFKEHNQWVADPSKPGSALPEPQIKKPIDKNDVLEISVGIKRDQFKKMIDELAGITPPVVSQAANSQTETRITAIEQKLDSIIDKLDGKAASKGADCGCEEKDKSAESIAKSIISKVAQGAGWAQKAESPKTPPVLGI